jgi:uncharacterized membrane protein (UPF0127 family)
MKKEKITINLGNKKIPLKVQKLSIFEMGRGLMFRKKKNSPNLLFEFPYSSKWKIHSWFVFFDFIAIWLDDEKNLLELNITKPWKFSVSPKKKSKYLIEIPLGKEPKKLKKFLDE